MNNALSVSRFSMLILKAGLRDVKTLAVTLGMPLFMLLSFWITTGDGSEESADLLAHMIPSICAMAVMMPGQTQATRLVNWREGGSLRRLALAPVPVPMTVAGITMAQAVIAVLQGLAVCLICLPISGQRIGPVEALIVLGCLPLTGFVFIALGFLLSAFFRRSNVTGYAFFAVFLPLFFLGSFPLEFLPSAVRPYVPWLPTSMGINLIDFVFGNTGPTAGPIFSALGLLGYAALFSAAGILMYRNKTS